MSRPRPVLVALSAALALVPIDGAASGSEYVRPVGNPAMVFPVARSTWYSVINLADDWHAPRMRLEAGRWRQTGTHEGNDIFGEPGTPILAVAPGTVENLGWTFYSGWRVGVRGNDGRYWFYAHLRGFSPDLREGTRVAAGTALGEMGNTGYGARPGHANEFTYHLHIGIQQQDGLWINPHPLMRRLYRAAVAAGR